MKNKILSIALCVFAVMLIHTSNAFADTVVSQVYLVDKNGTGMCIGSVTFSDTPKGLEITPNFKGLPPGIHGFHIHEKPSCASEMQDGKSVHALAAGGHYDPDNTGRHEGPMGKGHKGDLPILVVKPNGTATEKLLAPRLTVKEIKGRSVMIHAGGDNYSDKPLPLGGGGARIACGIIPE